MVREVCFSAKASFIAAGVLLPIGVVAVRRVRDRRLLPLAATPLLFAAQQLSEGVLWLHLEDAPFGKSPTAIAQVFLFFALFVWPAFVPFALLSAERRPERRPPLKVVWAIGAALGAYLMACSALRPSYSCIAFGNLYYAVAVDTPLKPLTPFVYVTSVLAPMIVSSLPGTKVLAAVTVVSFSIAGILFRAGFASVWCFFAAVLSGITTVVVLAAGARQRAGASVELPGRAS